MTRKIKTSHYVITVALIIALAFTSVLLDALVFEKTLVVVESATDTEEAAASIEAAIITTESYQDDNIQITIETVEENNGVYYVVDIQLTSIDYLKTAFANNSYGRNITEITSSIATNNNAILAINGDYYGFRDTGYVIRNGVLYRSSLSSITDEDLVIDADGNFQIVDESTTSAEALLEQGALQVFSFGPTLVLDGEAVSRNTEVSTRQNPRTAIGQIDELHYIFVVVDGRSSVSEGMTLSELSQVFVERGASIAYNLDGGGTSTLWFNGTVINNPTTNGRTIKERGVSDILYIGY